MGRQYLRAATRTRKNDTDTMGEWGQPAGVTHVAYAMAAASLVGGTAGYLKKKSTRSLLAGVVFGGCFVAAAVFMQNGQVARGYRFATINSAIMAAVMGYRAYKTGQLVPAGAVAGLAAASAVYHGHKYAQTME